MTADPRYLETSMNARDGGLSAELAGARSSAAQPPSSTAYTDFTSTPYGTLSPPYSQQQHCDSSISGAGSPSSISSKAQLIRQYPTPPMTSKMMWDPTTYHVQASTSQSASPMSVQPVSTESHYEMNYVMADPSTEQQQQQRKDVIPEPPIPYFGSYSVSGTTDCDPVPGSDQNMHYFVDGMHTLTQHIDPTLAPSALSVKHEPGMDMEMPQHQHQHQHQLSRHLLPAPAGYAPPMLNQQNLPQLRASHGRHVGSDEMNMIQGYDMHGRLTRNEPSPRHFKKPRVRGRKNSLAGLDREDGASTATKPKTSSLAAHKDSSSNDPSAEPIQFKDGMPETDRFLFELRQKHDDSKGKGMWEPITEEYNKRFGTKFDRAALQMRISRAKSKYVQWSSKDDEILYAAAKHVEKQYYRLIHMKYKELGGNPQADFNVGNIEMRMIELGLADVHMEAWKGDSKTSTRRRRKLNERLRHTMSLQAGAAGRDQHPQAHPRSQLHRLHFQQDMHTIDLSHQEREKVLDDIESRGYQLESPTPDASSMHGDYLDTNEETTQAERGDRDTIVAQQSERVAKQACDALLRNPESAAVGARRRSRGHTGSPQGRARKGAGS